MKGRSVFEGIPAAWIDTIGRTVNFVLRSCARLNALLGQENPQHVRDERCLTTLVDSRTYLCPNGFREQGHCSRHGIAYSGVSITPRSPVTQLFALSSGRFSACDPNPNCVVQGHVSLVTMMGSCSLCLPRRRSFRPG
jgi:hypothetical protein